MRAFGTLVKYTHGLISAPDLHLHKVSLVVIATGTDSHGSIHILPGRGTTQNIVHHLAFWVHFVTSAIVNGTSVRTSGAVKEARFSEIWSFFDLLKEGKTELVKTR